MTLNLPIGKFVVYEGNYPNFVQTTFFSLPVESKSGSEGSFPKGTRQAKNKLTGVLTLTYLFKKKKSYE